MWTGDCHFTPGRYKRTTSVTFFIILYVQSILVTISWSEKPVTFTDCGGTLTKDKGIISSPNFPNKFPTPISCRWIIQAPEGKGIALFFPQFYMREGMTATEYVYYSDNTKLHPEKIADITFKHVHVETKKPVMVLELNVKHINNVHLRVEDYFLNVFGFNITYEFMNKLQNIRMDTCSVYNCSFLGNCYASRGFLKYTCQCFEHFLGEYCQYGPVCNPARNINGCHNGGKCKYFMGSKSLTCECPEGYIGHKCEIKQKVSKECSLHGCSQTCRTNSSGTTVCACFNGFKMSSDGNTCLDTGRTRYLASIKLLNMHVAVNKLTKYNKATKLFNSIELELRRMFSSLEKVTNLTILNLGAGAVIDFHFFGEKQDSSKAKDILNKVVNQGNLGSHQLDKNYFKFEIEPALQLQDLELNKQSPFVVGDTLVLACGAVGSSSMKVTWFKNGALINVERASAYRKIQNLTQEPSNSDQKYFFELVAEKVTIHDAGLFTCQVTDWGVTQNKSIEVNVITPPKVSVTPMAVTLEEGGSVTLKCVEEVFFNQVSFKYVWSKNGELLKEIGDVEMIEDLYPVGSWLHISDIKTSATYSCTVNSKSGKIRKSVYVRVLAKFGSVKTCNENVSAGTTWAKAAANTFDIQLCPDNYIGDATRLCEVIHKGPPVWKTPDFSQCKTHEFAALQNQFEELKLGYMTTKATVILEKLLSLMNKQMVFYPGEGEPLVHLLFEVVVYLENYSKQIEGATRVSKVLFDICDKILSRPILLQKQEILLELHMLIKRQASFRTSLLERGAKEQIYMDYIGMENWKIGKSPKQGFISTRIPFKSNKRKPDWYNDTVDLRFNIHFQDTFVGGAMTLDMSFLVYRNLTALFPERGITYVDNIETEYRVASRILAVALNAGTHELGLTADSFKKSLKVRVRLQRQIPELSLNATGYNLSCALAELSGKKWNFLVDKSCMISEKGSTHATCTCDKLGTFALLMLFYPLPKGHIFAAKYDHVAYLGSIISLSFTVLTIFILIISYKRLKGPITFLKIQMCLAVVGAEASILHAVRQSITEDQFPYIVTSAQFFLIAAFSLHFCIALQIYVDFVKMEQLRYASFKIVLVGWGFPMIIVGATLAAQEMEGFDLKSWWVIAESNYFYGLVVPIIMMTILQLLLHLVVKSEIRRHFFVGPKVRTARKRSRLLTRILFTLLALILMSFSSIMYINFTQDIFKYFFALCSSILGFVLLLCFAVKSEEDGIFVACYKRHEREEMALDTVSRRSSVIDYKVVPEKFPTGISLDEDDIELVKKQNERLRKMKEKISREDSFGDTLDMKKDLIERISNHTGNGHYIPGSPVVAELTPDVIIAKGIYNPNDDDHCDMQDSLKQDILTRQSGPEGESRSASPFELQLLDNSPRSSIYYPRSRGAPSPNPWNILDPTQNEAFKCSDSDSYQADPLPGKPCPLHSRVSNPSSDVSHSDYSDSTTSSIDYVSHSSLPPQRSSSPYHNPFMDKLISEESTSESEEDISEATVKHKSPSPQKSFTSPSKLQSNRIGRLSDDPAILAYSTSPKKRRSSSLKKAGSDARSEPPKSPKNTTSV